MPQVQPDNAKIPHQKSTVARAFDAGRQATLNRFELLKDPAGDGQDSDRLRSMGKWRFILLRGAVGTGLPFFVWLVVTDFGSDIESAKRLHGSTLSYLFHFWAFGIGMSVFFGLIVGLFAWRRLTSDYWPNTKADPESTLTRMDPL